MKKILFAMFIIVIFLNGRMAGQSFDWNLRGGLNLMNSKTSGEDLSLLYHAGIQAGIRVASFGLYGEVLYSMHENQYGGDPVAYFAPALLGKFYLKKFIFVEFGGTMLSIIGDSGVDNDILNPDGKLFMFAGLGAKISKIELSLRSTVKQSYGVIQLTAALRF